MRIPCLDSPRAAYIWQVSMEPSKASTQKENGKLTANRSKGVRCAQNARQNVQYLGRVRVHLPAILRDPRPYRRGHASIDGGWA